MYATRIRRPGVLAALALLAIGSIAQAQQLAITEVCDAPLTGGQPKWVEITNLGSTDVPDLSLFSIGNFNNGSGALGFSSTQLNAVSLAAGESYVFAYEDPMNTACDPGGVLTCFEFVYGFPPDQFAGGGFVNGDDAIALFNGVVPAGTLGNDPALFDVYGLIGCDPNAAGTPCPEWEYTDSYSIRCWGGPSPVYNPAEWFFRGPDGLEHPAGDELEKVQAEAETSPGKHTGCYFGGLAHRALGQAQLQPDPGTANLVISNIGSSGLDGVSIDLGEAAEGMLGEGEMLTALPLPAGASADARNFGTVGGVPDQDLGGVRVDVDPFELTVVPDTQPLGTQTYRLELYDAAGNRVFSQGGMSGPAYRTPKLGWPVRFRVYCRLVPSPVFPFYRIRWCCRWFVLRPLTIPGGPIIQAAGMDIIPELQPATAPAVTSIGRVRCRTRFWPPVRVERSDIYALQQLTCAVDQARLEATSSPGGNKLKVSNLGSSGCDGFSVDLGGGDRGAPEKHLRVSKPFGIRSIPEDFSYPDRTS